MSLSYPFTREVPLNTCTVAKHKSYVRNGALQLQRGEHKLASQELALPLANVSVKRIALTPRLQFPSGSNKEDELNDL